MIKILAVLQMISGGLATIAARILVVNKAHTEIPYSGPHRGPSTALELAMLYIGLTILAFGLLLWKLNFKHGKLQLVSGLVIAIIGAFLAQQQNNAGIYLESTIYYLAYLPLVLGFVVVVTGIMQLITKSPKNSQM